MALGAGGHSAASSRLDSDTALVRPLGVAPVVRGNDNRPKKAGSRSNVDPLCFSAASLATGRFGCEKGNASATPESDQTWLALGLDSQAFDIDNTPPTFSGAAARVDGTRTVVTLDVKDDHSPVSKVEYSLDGVEWKAVFPTDGVADTRSEHYEIAVNGRIPARGLTIRAMDTLNNVATTQVDAPANAAR